MKNILIDNTKEGARAWLGTRITYVLGGRGVAPLLTAQQRTPSIFCAMGRSLRGAGG
jgi:hypothetical protein